MALIRNLAAGLPPLPKRAAVTGQSPLMARLRSTAADQQHHEQREDQEHPSPYPSYSRFNIEGWQRAAKDGALVFELRHQRNATSWLTSISAEAVAPSLKALFDRTIIVVGFITTPAAPPGYRRIQLVTESPRTEAVVLVPPGRADISHPDKTSLGLNATASAGKDFSPSKRKGPTMG